MSGSPTVSLDDERLKALLYGSSDGDELDKKMFFDKLEKSRSMHTNDEGTVVVIAASMDSSPSLIGANAVPSSVDRERPMHATASGNGNGKLYKSTDSRVSFDVSSVSSNTQQLPLVTTQELAAGSLSQMIMGKSNGSHDDEDLVNYAREWENTMRMSMKSNPGSRSFDAEKYELLKKVEALTLALEEEKKRRVQRSIEGGGIDSISSVVVDEQTLKERFEGLIGKLQPHVPSELLELVKREMYHQERLLVGFQKTNESLVEEMKAAKQQFQVREQELLSTVQRVRSESGLVQVPVDSELEISKHRIADLTTELSIVRSTLEEQRREVDHLREERRQLVKTAVVSANASNKKDDSAALREIIDKLTASRSALEKELSALREKAEFWQEQADWSEEKEKELQTLRQAVMPAGTGSTAAGRPMTVPSKKETVSGKKPTNAATAAAGAASSAAKKKVGGKEDKILQLIEATKPALESDRVRDLEKTVENLQREKLNLQETFESKIRALQVDFKRMQDGYQKKVSVLEEDVRQKDAHLALQSKKKHAPSTPAKDSVSGSSGASPSSLSPAKPVGVSEGVQTEETEAEAPRLTIISGAENGRRVNDHSRYREMELLEELKRARYEIQQLQGEADRISALLVEREKRTTEIQLDASRQIREKEMQCQETCRNLRREYEASFKQYAQDSQENTRAIQQVMQQLAARPQDILGQKDLNSEQSQILIMMSKISAMETQIRQRHESTSKAMEEIRQMATMEAEVAKKKFEIQLQRKQVELDQCRAELDALMDKLARLTKKKRKNADS
eukprot:ANDGO_00180.mRNA.1 hypothetical protein